MDLCVIILRHVTNPNTDKIWRFSYTSARKVYPDNQIIVIDDGSTIPPDLDNKTSLIKSEFPGRAEILPYYYFYKHHFADKALIIHDSVIINEQIDTDVSTYRFLWEFTNHYWDHDPGIVDLLFQYGEKMIDLYYRKLDWNGCFGGMSVIKYDFLKSTVEKHNLFAQWIPKIVNRWRRMHFERALAVVFAFNAGVNDSYFGDIHKWAEETCPGKVFGELGMPDHKSDVPFFKIWVGR